VIDRQLALLEAEPPAGLRWLVPALVAAAAASGALLFASVGEPLFAGLFLAGVVAMLVAAFILEKRGGGGRSGGAKSRRAGLFAGVGGSQPDA
jgi:two-component system cell cycle sensor histidine kinase/response regulator CckA